MTDIEAVAAAIRARRFRYANERQLQQGLAAALAQAGIPAEREVRLDAYCRIDLLAGRVGVEAKVAGDARALVRQLRRYLKSPRVDAVVVVTNQARHLRVPRELEGKPVEVVALLSPGL